jgi:hypothetical protein
MARRILSCATGIDGTVPCAALRATCGRANLPGAGSSLQRLAALIPRPRLNLIRFDSVLAPNTSIVMRLFLITRKTKLIHPLRMMLCMFLGFRAYQLDAFSQAGI